MCVHGINSYWQNFLKQWAWHTSLVDLNSCLLSAHIFGKPDHIHTNTHADNYIPGFPSVRNSSVPLLGTACILSPPFLGHNIGLHCSRRVACIYCERHQASPLFYTLPTCKSNQNHSFLFSYTSHRHASSSDSIYSTRGRTASFHNSGRNCMICPFLKVEVAFRAIQQKHLVRGERIGTALRRVVAGVQGPLVLRYRFQSHPNSTLLHQYNQDKVRNSTCAGLPKEIKVRF